MHIVSTFTRCFFDFFIKNGLTKALARAMLKLIMSVEVIAMTLSKNAKNAIGIGALCAIAYLAVYIARNVLGAVSPQMGEGGITDAYLGNLSSAFFMSYAVGQLINGAIGDKIKARYMISFGLILAGGANLLFSLIVIKSLTVALVAYGAVGFFLAMIYGPMTKVVAENTEPHHATRCSLGYTFSAFFGSPLAGVLATFLVWQSVFTVSSIMLLVMGVLCFLAFLLFEKKGIVKYGRYKTEKKEGGSIKALMKHHFIKYCLISIITGIVRTAVVFWMTKYFADHLGYSAQQSSAIYTVTTLIISLTPFISVFVYERLHRNMELTILLMFGVATVSFLCTYLIGAPMVNIVFFVLSIMGSNAAASMLWSRYCPSLRDTGVVSGATGFLDFLSYMAAAASSSLFGNAVSVVGWGNLILIWFGLMVAGVIVSLPYGKIFKKKSGEEPPAASV